MKFIGRFSQFSPLLLSQILKRSPDPNDNTREPYYDVNDRLHGTAVEGDEE